ncbi:hypothetical protein C7I87_24845 [Mesorhizobium sp. SARCC-RB16n]|nr:hypothetical protein C7I87_24845 [Mesorhizobium sp. SARCC-RB16n]
MANRYALRMEHPHSWTIFDVFTGEPAVVKQRIMVGMDTRDADAMVVQMNVRDIKRREKAERKS